MKEALNKKRKVSKKTKKSWRKHVDTKDVDNFLDEKRLEERLGAPFSERSDGELFAVDKSPEKKSELTSKQQRRLALKSKEPVCFAILKPHTAIPDPIAKRNRVKTPEERKNPITRRIQAMKRLNGQLKLKEIDANKNKALAEKKRVNKPKLGEFDKDIWMEKKKVHMDVQSEWLTSDTVRHTLANTGQKQKRVPLSLSNKPSVVPAVQAPHPGTSYNPSYTDHQELLAVVAKKEMELMKQEAHLDRVTTKMFKKVSADKKNDSWMQEMSEGLPTKSKTPDETSDTEDHDPNVKSVNPPSKNEKKPLVKRRKQKEQRQLELERKQAKVEKKKVADIYKIKKIATQISAKEKKEEFLRRIRAQTKERKIAEPKTLSKVKFEAPEPDFELAEELVGNLRNSKTVGNLLRDRYKSLQQRNILAPGTRMLKLNKAKVKKFEKASHKMGWEDTFK
ncbi:ribosome biogenesis protein NOP53 [Neodiprion pinetum]|uniref:Ribosome biogenesis protein NOP53 n=1 Tax=Neodiprion lecontei TaxID=441921 RepID=A0A6J0B887_NEOLC|nr:ribosome biogenesis protein NOP53 [Neodiprion lecontei]XP_015510413.2 ribosome biogenesis protein NOP53 [Neodiprion lecontei]XP_046480225.1 ribosome biogenesis protein NOP53 [Neodiprion pinetum]XP_046480226.1 ribosome biogenesis protein NOP53 [Neodiprion pinetum]XP_046480228.1 ribosome biogenesis protein NOP53 [Neodiprion pinetum]XP_046594871.1 ribosome biogenesis protein NOP53 [Neodiprion lecontei]